MYTRCEAVVTCAVGTAPTFGFLTQCGSECFSFARLGGLHRVYLTDSPLLLPYRLSRPPVSCAWALLPSPAWVCCDARYVPVKQNLLLLHTCMCPPLCIGALWLVAAWVWRDVRFFGLGTLSTFTFTEDKVLPHILLIPPHTPPPLPTSATSPIDSMAEFIEAWMTSRIPSHDQAGVPVAMSCRES